MQPDTVAGNRADADFRSGQVLQDRNLAAKLAFEMADFADHTAVKSVIAVAKVEPRDVHAGADETLDNLIGCACGADGANDFSATHFE